MLSCCLRPGEWVSFPLLYRRRPLNQRLTISRTLHRSEGGRVWAGQGGKVRGAGGSGRRSGWHSTAAMQVDWDSKTIASRCIDQISIRGARDCRYVQMRSLQSTYLDPADCECGPGGEARGEMGALLGRHATCVDSGLVGCPGASWLVLSRMGACSIPYGAGHGPRSKEPGPVA